MADSPRTTATPATPSSHHSPLNSHSLFPGPARGCVALPGRGWQSHSHAPLYINFHQWFSVQNFKYQGGMEMGSRPVAGVAAEGRAGRCVAEREAVGPGCGR